MASVSHGDRSRVWCRSVIGVGAIALAGVGTACGDAPPVPTAHRATMTRSLGLSPQDSVTAGYFARRSAGNRTPSRDAVSDGTASIVSVTPSFFQGFAQPAAIQISPSGPVNLVTVIGHGAIECSGDYGTLIAFDATGTELGEAPSH